jgi:hypothetical protein
MLIISEECERWKKGGICGCETRVRERERNKMTLSEDEEGGGDVLIMRVK